jgi:hypothetical protein
VNEGQQGKTSKPPNKSTCHIKQAWRDVLPVHPAAELFPLMSEAELRELGEDIKKNGLKTSIAIYCTKGPDEKRQYWLLDGRNRLDAMKAVGLAPKLSLDKQGRWILTLEGVDENDVPQPLSAEGEPYAYVISANIHRRHLTSEQKRDLIAKLLKATPEKSNRQIAKIVGRSHPHVAKVREELERAGDVETVTTSIDTKGRKQATKRKRRTIEDFKRDIAAKKAAVPKPPPTEITIHEAVAPDEEIALLREFARFVIGRARVSTDPKDAAEWKMLLARIKQALGVPSHPPAGPGKDDGLDIPAFLRRAP